MRLREKLNIKLFEAWFQSMSMVEKALYGTTLNVFDKAVINDPYPHFNRMRENRPIHYSLALRGSWVTS